MSLSPSLQIFRKEVGKFIERAPDAEVRRIFPGRAVAPAECVLPICIKVDEAFGAFRIIAGKDKPISLCFSKMVFIGFVGDDFHLRNLEKYADCSQSSAHPGHADAQAGVRGAQFTNNMHSAREIRPWWQADFPEDVRVKYIIYYPRADWHIIKNSHIKIVGIDGDSETVLYYPQSKEGRRTTLPGRIDRALDAIEALAEYVPAEDAAHYNAIVEDVFEALALKSAAAPPQKPSVLDKLLGRGPKGEGPASLPDQARRVQQADRLLKALGIALGGAKDFGISPNDALEIKLPAVEASEIRFRVYGEKPRGLGGVELFGPEGEAVADFGRDKLKFHYRLPAFSSPESFRLGMFSEISSRRLDLGGVKKISALKVWNLNQQDAANTLFLEVAVRTDPEGDWKVVYDHGAPYRLVGHALDLVNMLLGSKITAGYCELLGKMLTQYRRRRLMKPVATLTRGNKALHDAVFKGSTAMSLATRFAAPLRLGKHGLGVPIAYRETSVVMGHLTKMRDEVRALGHKPMLLYGTLLGAIREKDFIPHDDDVDLAVLIEGVGPEGLNEACDTLIETLNNAGIKANRGSPVCPLIHCHRPPITYDIFVLGCVGDTVYWPHKGLQIVPERADIFLPVSTIEFKGEIFDAPADPEAVCRARYGDDWHIPNPAFEW